MKAVIFRHDQYHPELEATDPKDTPIVPVNTVDDDEDDWDDVDEDLWDDEDEDWDED